VVKIRDANFSDLPAIVALEAAVYEHPWSEAIIRDEMALANRTYLVVENEDAIVGFGGVMFVEEDAHITTLGIAPEQRRQYLGSRLLLALIDRALDAGIRHLTLEVRESNFDAQQLYEQFGFASVGKRHGYYQGEDAVVMWATDIDADEYQDRLDAIRTRLGEAA
jgi:[ribosomal protein S18]-alanine N-acetyltransferase